MSQVVVWRSNRLEVLTRALGEALAADVPEDPFAPLQVAVGSRGMERHLRHCLAEHPALGICAHVAFPFPATALDMALGWDPKTGDPWSPDRLVWALIDVLPVLAGDPRMAPVVGYLGGEEVVRGVVGARTWSIARAVADLFDRYVTYRPELATAWSAGSREGAEDDTAWQPVWWQAVQQHLDVPHRADRIAEALASGTLPPGPPLRLFGLAALPPSWLAVLDAIARVRRVELYLLVPSEEWWADLQGRRADLPPVLAQSSEVVSARLASSAPGGLFGEAGHPLLLSWGRLARDAQILLECLPHGYQELVDYGTIFVDPLDQGSPSLLRWLQHDLFVGSHPYSLDPQGFEARALAADDRSVQLHTAHGPMRQVEVLREVLLGLLQDDPTLRPRDIVVMTPDVEGMAPRIRAVFDDGGDSSPLPKIPWELTDRAVRRQNPVAEALMGLLAHAEGRLGRSEVLDWLSLEPVSERFGLTVEDLEAAFGWFDAAGIAWGEDADDRSRHDQPAESLHTWRFGLRRLLMGVLHPDRAADRSDGVIVHGVRPLETVEGARAASVGRLVQACASLFAQRDRLRAPRSMAAWSEALLAALDAVVQVDGRMAWRLERVRTTVRELAAGSARPVSLDAVQAALAGAFDLPDGQSHGAGGAVTFCGMVPERAVPYRVVVLLGMDEGAFPRVGGRPAYDLAARAPLLGDRSVRDEDRTLMLEAVLSARDHLVVLWTGKDPRTNEALPPCVPVAELLDALDATVPSPGEGARPSAVLHHAHPLHPHDPTRFQGDPPQAWDPRLLAAIQGEGCGASVFRMAKDATGDRPTALTVDRLHDVWRHPTRTYLRRGLGLWIPRPDAASGDDREPLVLGKWAQRDLFAWVWRAVRSGRDSAEALRLLEAAGDLPAGGSGQAEVLALRARAEEMVGILVGFGGAAALPEPVAIDHDLGGVRVTGTVDDVHGDTVFRVAAGQGDHEELLALWTDMALATVAGRPIRQGIVITWPKTEPYCLGLQADEGVLRDAASWLVEHAVRAHAEPLPVFRNASLALARTEPDASDRLDKALEAYLGGERTAGDAGDRWVRHAYGETIPILTEDEELDPVFETLSRGLWFEVLDRRKTHSKLKAWEVTR